jgi:methylase of polypeptide subunit release factors
MLKPPPSQEETGTEVFGADIDLEILGVDLSPTAVKLAWDNLNHNIEQGNLHPDARKDIKFVQSDVLKMARARRAGSIGESIRSAFNELYDSSSAHAHDRWDVVISNPPYVSSKDHAPGGRTEASVRKYEPKSALVPAASAFDEVETEDGLDSHMSLSEHQHKQAKSHIDEKGAAESEADAFYWPIMRIGQYTGAKLTVVEVGDSEQARRVQRKARNKNPFRSEPVRDETWRDDGSVVTGLPDEGSKLTGEEESVSDRAVVFWRGEWAKWRAQTQD